MEPTVYFAIITANKPNQPSRFSLHITVRFGNKAQNANFRLKNNTKHYTYQSSIFNPNICSKIKSLHVQQTSRSDLGIWLVLFLSTFYAGYISAILSDPVLRLSRPKRVQVSSHPVLPAKYRIH